MERSKIIKLGALGGAAVVLFVMTSRMNQPAPPPPAPVAQPVVEAVEHEFVLVTTQDIQRGARINVEMLDWQEWPADAVAPSFVVRESRPQAIEELVDAVVRTDMFAGEPVNDGKLVRAGDSGLMAALLGPGMRAVTTRVTVDSAAGGFIMPGDKVDILLTRPLPRDNNTQGGQRGVQLYASATVFEDVKVLAINDRYSTGPDSPASVQSVSYATFELNPEDAETLEEAAEMGSISLTLRGLSPNGFARSAARIQREDAGPSSTVTVYRNGQQTQTAIRGQ